MASAPAPPDAAIPLEATRGEFRPPTPLKARYLLDRLLALLAIVLLLPLWALIALAIAIDSLAAGEAPQLLVSETRLSAERPFELLKFRVFRLAPYREHLARGRPRSIKALERPELLTRVGRVLQAFYLDELPQVWNIARGEMCLVGPRPYFQGDWERVPLLHIPARRCLKAGIVGPYQAVKGEVSGLALVNEIDSEYFNFVRSASFAQLVARDASLIRRSVRTAMAGEGL